MEILNEFRLPGFKWFGFERDYKPFYFTKEYNDQFIEEWNSYDSKLPASFKAKLIKLMNSEDIVVGHMHRNSVTKLLSGIGKWLIGDVSAIGAYFMPQTGKIYIPSDMGLVTAGEVNWVIAEFLLAHEICHYLADAKPKIFFAKTYKILFQFYSTAMAFAKGEKIPKALIDKLLKQLIIFENAPSGPAFQNLMEAYEAILGDKVEQLFDSQYLYNIFKHVYDAIPGIRLSRKTLNQGYGQELVYPSEVICTFHSHVIFGAFGELNKTINSMM